MTAQDDCESCGATSADKCVCGVHSCSYECDRPACVRRQRDELRDMMYSRDDKKAALPEPELFSGYKLLPYEQRFFGLKESRDKLGYVNDTNEYYTAAQLESYAVARVAEATAELRSELERARGWNERVSVCRDHVAEIVDGECVVCQRDELQGRVAELEANDRRYRWLREHLVNWCPNDGTANLSWHAREVLDCIIDTSILADREGGKA